MDFWGEEGEESEVKGQRSEGLGRVGQVGRVREFGLGNGNWAMADGKEGFITVRGIGGGLRGICGIARAGVR